MFVNKHIFFFCQVFNVKVCVNLVRSWAVLKLFLLCLPLKDHSFQISLVLHCAQGWKLASQRVFLNFYTTFSIQSFLLCCSTETAYLLQLIQRQILHYHFDLMLFSPVAGSKGGKGPWVSQMWLSKCSYSSSSYSSC